MSHKKNTEVDVFPVVDLFQQVAVSFFFFFFVGDATQVCAV